HLLRLFHLVLLIRLMLLLPTSYLLLFSLALHSLLLALLRIIDPYPRLRYHLHRSLLVTLQMKCYPILFSTLASLLFYLVRYFPSLSLFASLSLMLGLTHLLRLFRPESLSHLL